MNVQIIYLNLNQTGTIIIVPDPLINHHTEVFNLMKTQKKKHIKQMIFETTFTQFFVIKNDETTRISSDLSMY